MSMSALKLTPQPEFCEILRFDWCNRYLLDKAGGNDITLTPSPSLKPQYGPEARDKRQFLTLNPLSMWWVIKNNDGVITNFIAGIKFKVVLYTLMLSLISSHCNAIVIHNNYVNTKFFPATSYLVEAAPAISIYLVAVLPINLTQPYVEIVYRA
jgi:hypothetical protein